MSLEVGLTVRSFERLHFCSSKITEDVRKYAAEQEFSDEQALQTGMQQKCKEFTAAGAEVYSKA